MFPAIFRIASTPSTSADPAVGESDYRLGQPYQMAQLAAEMNRRF
jgi:hypothetical protein